MLETRSFDFLQKRSSFFEEIMKVSFLKKKLIINKFLIAVVFLNQSILFSSKKFFFSDIQDLVEILQFDNINSVVFFCFVRKTKIQNYLNKFFEIRLKSNSFFETKFTIRFAWRNFFAQWDEINSFHETNSFIKNNYFSSYAEEKKQIKNWN